MALKKLTPKELEQKKAAGTANADYVAFLQGLKAGEGAEASVADEGVSKQTIKNRIKKAADYLGLEVSFVRSGKDIVVFEVAGEK